MVSALALLAAIPLKLELSLPESVAPGEEIHARCNVRNVSNRPVTLVTAILPNIDLGMSLERRLRGPSGPVIPDEIGPMMGQWFSGQTVTEDSFFTLAPGECRDLYAETFSKRFLGARPGTTSEYVKAPRAPLWPGAYRYRIAYRLSPAIPTRTVLFGPDMRERSTRKSQFTPEARRLFDARWRGEVFAETTLIVADR